MGISTIGKTNSGISLIGKVYQSLPERADGARFRTTQTNAVELPGACLPHAGPVLRAFVSSEERGFSRSAIGQHSEVQRIFSVAYARQYFYEYLATGDCVSVSRGAFRRCSGRDMETGARARGLAVWAHAWRCVSVQRVAPAKVPGAYTQTMAHSGPVPQPQDSPVQIPATMMPGGARCVILIASDANTKIGAND